MFNYFNPQSMVTNFDTKTKEYLTTFLDTVTTFQVSNVKSFDQLTDNLFTTYTKKVVAVVDKINVNAKEIIKYGDFKVTTPTGHKE